MYLVSSYVALQLHYFCDFVLCSVIQLLLLDRFIDSFIFAT